MASTAERLFAKALQSHQDGQLLDAQQACAKVLRLAPAHADALNVMGLTYLQRGEYRAGVPYIRRAIAVSPRHAEAHNNLGNALHALRQVDDAIACYRAALSLKPAYASAHNNLANVHKDLKRYDEAVAGYRRALSANPEFAEAHNNLGNALFDLGRCEEAHAHYAKALAIKPRYADAHSNMGNALRAMNRPREAVASFDTALAIQPDFHEAAWNRSHCHLMQGHFAQGWQDYEMRWRRKEKTPLAPTPLPCWLGQADVAGRKLLVQAEQGFGDAIQMLRYVRVLHGRRTECWVQVQPALRRLVARSLPFAHVVGPDACPPGLDWRVPVMSLPLAMRTFSPGEIPGATPYLCADPSRRAHWAARVAQAAARGPRIGFAWRGNPDHQNDRQRSASLGDFMPLIARQPSAHFFSLQKGLEPAERDALAAHANVSVLDAELHDFDETAAAMDALDAVISVDSAPAHLAGALGKRTWILLPFSAEWRWLMERGDSPWYPSARLFRQRAPGDWSQPMGALDGALAELQTGTSPISLPESMR